ncbi:MAG: PaaI family thioesterase [Candidatus Odinarchaeota archaeon]
MSSFINSSPFFPFLGMKILELRYGESFLELKLKECHLQSQGVVHGGVLAALLDAAGTLAAVTQIEGFHSAVTVEMKINFLSNVKNGTILGRGRCIKLGRTIGVSEATITTGEQKIVAHGLVTVMIKDPVEFPGMDEVPPKLL